MATWTTIPNADVAVGAPLDTALMTALRDNPQAIAEGASGAPKIQNAAFDNGEIGSEKFQSGAAEETWVRERIANTGTDVVGAYAMLREDGITGNDTVGITRAGSGLVYSGVSSSSGTIALTSSSANPSGTWRLMGKGWDGGGSTSGNYASLWLRIS